MSPKKKSASKNLSSAAEQKNHEVSESGSLPAGEGQPVDFEASLERLEQIVMQLERGEMGLGESLKQYEEGIACLRKCQEALEVAETKIEQLFRIDEEGQGHVRPFDHEASE